MRKHDARLLADILNEQEEPEDFDLGAFERDLWAALTQGGRLTPELERAIWRIPSARASYLAMREANAERVRRLWSGRGFATEAVRRAADSGGRSHKVTATGWSFQTVQSQATGEWLVTLQVEPEAMALLTEGTPVRVVDSEGLVWLEGRLDRLGGLDGRWAHPDVNPEERMLTHALTFKLR